MKTNALAQCAAQKLSLALVLATLFLSGGAMASDLGYEEFTLDNGLNMVVVPMEGTPRVACRVVYNVGSANDKPGKTGMAHFLEHMMFKGTKSVRTKDWEAERVELDKLDQIAAELAEAEAEVEAAIDADQEPAADLLSERDDLREAFAAQQTLCDDFIDGPQFNSYYLDAGGTGINAWTNPDRTVYTVNLPANKLELFFLLESDRMANSVLRSFYSEKQVVLEERRRAVAGAKRRYYEQINALLHEAAPYRNPNLGWPEDVQSITRQEMFAYYQEYYVPNNATLVLAGHVGIEDARELAQLYFGELKRAPHPDPLYTTNPPPAVETTLQAEMNEKPEIRLVYPTVAHHHQHGDALEAMAWWLDSRSGPLYRELVVEEQLAVGVSVWHYGQKISGRFEIVVRPVDITRREEISRRMDAIIQSVLDGDEGYALEEKHLTAYISSWERGLIDAMSTPDSAATTLANWYYTSGIEALGKRPARIRTLDVATTLQVAQQYLQPKRRVRAFIIPPQLPRPIDPALAAEAELQRRIAEEEDADKKAQLQRLLDALRAKRQEDNDSGTSSSAPESDAKAPASSREEAQASPQHEALPVAASTSEDGKG